MYYVLYYLIIRILFDRNFFAMAMSIVQMDQMRTTRPAQLVPELLDLQNLGILDWHPSAASIDTLDAQSVPFLVMTWMTFV